MAASSPDQSCLTLLRDLDRDRYIAALLSPAEKRETLAALYCFNAEIARIRDVTREVLPGEIRLQWWRDVLEGKSVGDANAHPVAGPLLKVIADYSLPVSVLLDLIEARTFDLYDDSFDSMNMLEGYAGESASAIIQLASLILNPEAAKSHAEAAGHAGVAQAMAGVMLLAPIHRSRQQLYVPLEILNAVGLDRDAFLRGERKEEIAGAIDIFCTKGLEHLNHAKRQKIHADLVPAYLPVAIVETVLKRAKALGAGIFDHPLQPSEMKRYWLVLKASLRKSL